MVYNLIQSCPSSENEWVQITDESMFYRLNLLLNKSRVLFVADWILGPPPPAFIIHTRLYVNGGDIMFVYNRRWQMYYETDEDRFKLK